MIQRCEGDTLILPKRAAAKYDNIVTEGPFPRIVLDKGGALSKEEVPVVIMPLRAEKGNLPGRRRPSFPIP